MYRELATLTTKQEERKDCDDDEGKHNYFYEKPEQTMHRRHMSPRHLETWAVAANQSPLPWTFKPPIEPKGRCACGSLACIAAANQGPNNRLTANASHTMQRSKALEGAETPPEAVKDVNVEALVSAYCGDWSEGEQVDPWTWRGSASVRLRLCAPVAWRSVLRQAWDWENAMSEGTELQVSAARSIVGGGQWRMRRGGGK